MKNKILKVSRLVILGLVLFVAACSMPSSVPICPSDLLMEPQLYYPYNWSTISSLTPILDWGYPPSLYPYPYPAGECRPESYHIRLKIGPFFTDDLGTTIGGETSKWRTPALQPGTEYEWTVQAIIGAEESSPPPFYYFFTGPLCPPSSLVAAIPLAPANGSTVSTVNPSLIWDNPPACAAQGWRVQLSSDSTFGVVTHPGYINNPSTRWGPGSDLDDCTTYYWHVQPVAGSSNGPWSPTWSFRVETGSVLCAPSLGAVIEIPDFVLDQDAHCRVGPGVVYPIRSSLTAGMVVPIVGRNQAGDWYFVQLPDDNLCWVADLTGTPDGDVSLVQVLPDPATPTFTPIPTVTNTPRPERVNCSKYTNDKACSANQACTWVRGVTGGGGSCKNK